MAQRKRPRKRYHNYPFGVALAACIGAGLILGAFFDQISWGAFIGVVIGSSIELYLMMTRAQEVL